MRRRATVPITDALVIFPAKLIYDIGVNISLVGIAPGINRKYIGENPFGGGYSAGDILPIYISFTSPVYVLKYLQKPGNPTPFILIDSGQVNATNVGVAYYIKAFNATTLLFGYEARLGDNTSLGLHIKCDCKDYFNRTFIHLNDSIIMAGTVANPSGFAASNTLAEDSLRSSLLLQSSPIEIIINTPPLVLDLFSNISIITSAFADISPIVISPGAAVLISVRFNGPVSVSGIVRLVLRGGDEKSPLGIGSRSDRKSVV